MPEPFSKREPSAVLTALSAEQADIVLSLIEQRNPGEVRRDLLPYSSLPMMEPFFLTVNEGGKKLRMHYERERRPELVAAKREAVLAATGRLSCAVCKFDFSAKYGAFGGGFCEVHHKKPLAELEEPTKTTIDDLAVLCSNCHWMIHKDGLKSLAELERILGQGKVRRA